MKKNEIEITTDSSFFSALIDQVNPKISLSPPHPLVAKIFRFISKIKTHLIRRWVHSFTVDRMSSDKIVLNIKPNWFGKKLGYIPYRIGYISDCYGTGWRKQSSYGNYASASLAKFLSKEHRKFGKGCKHPNRKWLQDRGLSGVFDDDNIKAVKYNCPDCKLEFEIFE